MATDYLTCAQTAALVRKALKESVPDIKFSVRSNTYSGGASIRVVWTDGPNEILVDSVIGHLKASYFDGGIDYRGSIFHMVNGRPVRLGADSINLHREYTDALTELAIGRVYRRLHNAFVTRESLGQRCGSTGPAHCGMSALGLITPRAWTTCSKKSGRSCTRSATAWR